MQDETINFPDTAAGRQIREFKKGCATNANPKQCLINDLTQKLGDEEFQKRIAADLGAAVWFHDKDSGSANSFVEKLLNASSGVQLRATLRTLAETSHSMQVRSSPATIADRRRTIGIRSVEGQSSFCKCHPCARPRPQHSFLPESLESLKEVLL